MLACLTKYCSSLVVYSQFSHLKVNSFHEVFLFRIIWRDSRCIIASSTSQSRCPSGCGILCFILVRCFTPLSEAHWKLHWSHLNLATWDADFFVTSDECLYVQSQNVYQNHCLDGHLCQTLIQLPPGDALDSVVGKEISSSGKIEKEDQESEVCQDTLYILDTQSLIFFLLIA